MNSIKDMKTVDSKLASHGSAEDILELVKRDGVEITDGELDKVSGGAWGQSEPKKTEYCPYCGSEHLSHFLDSLETRRTTFYVCNGCGRGFAPDKVVLR